VKNNNEYMNVKCSVEGCTTKFFALKYCRLHYGRFRRTGTVLPRQPSEKSSNILPIESFRGNWITLECETCARLYVRRECNIRSIKDFCTTDCQTKYSLIKNRNKINYLKDIRPLIPILQFKRFWHKIERDLRIKNSRVNIECNICGDEFNIIRSLYLKHVFHHCKKCAKISVNGICKIQLLKCEKCSMLFIRDKSKEIDNIKRFKRKGNKFCSQECSQTRFRPKADISEEKFNITWKSFWMHLESHVTVECHREGCKNKYTGYTSCPNKYCSHDCYKKDKNKKPVWNKGKTNYLSDEARQKMSTAHIGQTAWNKGVPHTEATKIKLRKARAGRIYPYQDSWPERIMQKALQLNKITFKKHIQFKMRQSRFHRVDMFIEPNICIEVDGDYFHKLPERIERDKKVNEDLIDQGQMILRYWEKDIHKNVQECINDILKHLQK